MVEGRARDGRASGGRYGRMQGRRGGGKVNEGGGAVAVVIALSTRHVVWRVPARRRGREEGFGLRSGEEGQLAAAYIGRSVLAVFRKAYLGVIS